MRTLHLIISLLAFCLVTTYARAENLPDTEKKKPDAPAAEAQKPKPAGEKTPKPPVHKKKVDQPKPDPKSEPEPNPKPKKQPEKLNIADLPPTYKGMPFLFIPKLTEIKELDGKLEDEVWEHAASVDMGGTESAKPPKYPTQAKVFCTKEALYFGFRCDEPAMEDLKTGAGQVWTHDEIELFIEPYKDTIKRNYHQICVDADQATWSGRMHMYTHYGNAKTQEKWTPDFVATTHKGEKYWSMEIHLPFKELKFSKEAQKKATLWRLNMYRLRPEKGDDKTMQWAFSTTETSAFHTPAKFGYCLPETYASNALLEEVRAHPDAPPAEPPPVLPSTLTAKVQKLIGELGADYYVERKRAGERLEKIFADTKISRAAILEALQEAGERSREPHLAWAALALWGDLNAQGGISDEDDPPPGHIVKRWRQRQGLAKR